MNGIKNWIRLIFNCLAKGEKFILTLIMKYISAKCNKRVNDEEYQKPKRVLERRRDSYSKHSSSTINISKINYYRERQFMKITLHFNYKI